MPRSGRVLRKASLILVAAVSAFCGLVLLWRETAEARLSGAPTEYLLWLLALLVLPGVTLAAIELDRRANAGPPPAPPFPKAPEHAHPGASRRASARHRRRVRHAFGRRAN